MRILAVDAALSRCSVSVVVDSHLIAERWHDGPRGQAAVLATMTEEVLREVGMTALDLDLIGVTVGPGSFTGIRAALALAQGIGLGTGKPVIGVTVAEAMASSLPDLGRRVLWTAIDNRRGRVFLDQGQGMVAHFLDDLPGPDRPVAVAGDAASQVAARLAARDINVMLTDARRPLGRHIALVAARRAAGEIPPCAAEPMYVDAPEARLPASGQRPPPVA